MPASRLPSPKAAAALPWLRASEVARTLQDARRRTLELFQDLTDEQLQTPLLSIINPPLWEVGHVGWFQEKWVLRHLRGEPPILEQGDALFDSAAIAHDTRWGLPLLSRAETVRYLDEVLRRILDRLPATELDEKEAYFHWLAAMHEDMHGEAFTYTRQTLAYPAPKLSPSPVGQSTLPKQDVGGDADVPGGDYLLGADQGEVFVFDNEKWAHPVRVEPFALARTPVTNSQFTAFVDAGGYGRKEFWSEEGWHWREKASADHPLYWVPDAAGWHLHHFDQVVPLPGDWPVLHINWYEAEAYCRWAGRRLPTEAEWEMAATAQSGSNARRRYPWGDQPPSPDRAHLDGSLIGCVPVAAKQQGDSPFGCRQMIGNVWEWTASTFGPYPGFVVDPYKEYSQPWFTGDYKVLRGGCWATRARLIRNTWRNFYTKDRRDVFAGFRTCAL